MLLAQEIYLSNYNMFFSFFGKVDNGIIIEIILKDYKEKKNVN